jgi:hypothetical protein
VCRRHKNVSKCISRVNQRFRMLCAHFNGKPSSFYTARSSFADDYIRITWTVCTKKTFTNGWCILFYTYWQLTSFILIYFAFTFLSDLTAQDKDPSIGIFSLSNNKYFYNSLLQVYYCYKEKITATDNHHETVDIAFIIAYPLYRLSLGQQW